MGDFVKMAGKLARAVMIVLAIFVSSAGGTLAKGDAAVTEQFAFQKDSTAGKLRVTLGDHELFVYNYGSEWDLPHFFPLNTPSGINLLVEKMHPYPHHRGFWVADTVVRGGVKGDIYNAYYTGKKAKGKNNRKAPFVTGVRHVSFEFTTGTPRLAGYTEDLVWETSRTATAYPLLNERREVRLHALSGGNYLVDFEFELRAAYGDVEFVSDPVHYAWPYLRLDKTFSGDNGGTITAQSGATGQEATNMLPSTAGGFGWIDYSNPLGGAPEGVAIFQHPAPEYGTGARKWLTREYGTFGPRRPDEKSGTELKLKKGDALRQRVGIYVHRGDVDSGHVAKVYDKYVKGTL